MVEIKLTNTRSRLKERFVPIDPQDVRMYLCGPTVYDRAHLGNARPVVVFDVLYRLLRHAYGADHVTYVRNFTDVDDKINAAALARKEAGDPRSLEELIRVRTEETIRWYHEDMDALGALRPSIRGEADARAEPRATDYIPRMIAMIEALIARGHAYAAGGHVLFDVRSYPDYGRLSGRSIDDMIAGARVEVAPFKRDPMDFVLWKPSSEEEPGWDSPWGRGRPGWHIECSAMSAALLGESFDIHGGGIDLQFPHHENEIAQSCCAHPHADFARLWLHNEMLQVEGRKMSKSLGNFFTVRDLLDQGIPGEVIRYVFLMTHYRKPMDWTAEKVREAEATLRKWHSIVEGVEAAPQPSDSILDVLADDLNTPGVISVLHSLQEHPSVLKASANFVGLLGDLQERAQPALMREAFEIANLIFIQRAQARAEKDWNHSDILRAWLQISGFSVQDAGAGKLVMTTSEEAFGWQTLAQCAQKGDTRVPVDVLIKLAKSRGVDLKLEASDPVGAIFGRLNTSMSSEYLQAAAAALGLRR